MARRRLAACFLALGLLAGTGVPAVAQDEAAVLENVKTIYMTWHFVAQLVDACWEVAGYGPGYKEAGEEWNVRNIAAKDVASAALTAIGYAPEVMEGAAAALPPNPEAMPGAQADPAGYCQGVVTSLNSGNFDLERQFGPQLTALRAVAGATP